MKPLSLLLALALPFAARAELKLPAIIGDNMVLQQKLSDPVWGWDAPGTNVTVSFAGQTKSAVAGADGRWEVKLDAMPANAQPQTMTIKGTSERALQNILIGEVWMCSGQSNMSFGLNGDWNGDIEALGSNIPNLRLVSVPNVGTQEMQNDFKGAWGACTPESCKGFSAVGFFFGRHLQQILGVPVGLINNAWGGSSAEAWVRRESLEKDERFKSIMESTKLREETAQTEKAKTDYAAALVKWKADDEKAKAAHLPQPRKPGGPDDWLKGNARPGNIFNGIMNPTLGYGMKGVIWYQGESNSGRAWEYAQLFPYMIEQWRAEWKQGDFPFYWVQLADFQPEKPEPGDSAWAELRESQTKTEKLPNTGQCVIIDLGEGKDIHPKNKHDVAARLVRLALAKDYGVQVSFHSPEFKSVQINGSKATITLNMFGSSLRAFDVAEARGFAVCGEDKVWHWAKGILPAGTTDKIEVTCDAVEKPIAVRYAWADNPVCNLFTQQGLPVTPFRTDDFEMTTKPKPVVAPGTRTQTPRPAATPRQKAA